MEQLNRRPVIQIFWGLNHTRPVQLIGFFPGDDLTVFSWFTCLWFILNEFFTFKLFGGGGFKLMASCCIPLDSSFEVLEKFVKFDLIWWTCWLEIIKFDLVKVWETLYDFIKLNLTELISIEFHVVLYRLIALWMFYQKSFQSNAIRWSVRSQIIAKQRGSRVKRHLAELPFREFATGRFTRSLCTQK